MKYKGAQRAPLYFIPAILIMKTQNRFCGKSANGGRAAKPIFIMSISGLIL